MPNLSIVIPSYNHEDYIAVAVESCLNQTVNDLELIIVDDGSKDRSLPFLRKVRDSRVKLIEQENRGAHAAINRGLAAAEGAYLAILNSDDRFSPERCERLIEALQTKNAGLACSWVRQMDAQGDLGPTKKGWENQLPGWAMGVESIPSNSPDPFLEHLARSNFISTTSNMLFSRDLYRQIGGMRNLRFAHDWDFALRAACNSKCVIVEEPLLDYRTHGSNTIRTNKDWMMFEVVWMFAVHMRPVVRRIAELGASNRTYLIKPPINLGDNIQVYYALIRFLEAHRGQGRLAPEEILLDDVATRQAFIDQLN